MLGMTVCFSTLWRFPYQVANFGGAAYVAIYLLIAGLFVYPALTAEWGLGRFTGRGPDGAYKNVNFPFSRGVSLFLFAVVLAIGSYFAVWIGWIVRYAYSSLFDGKLSSSSTDSAQYFDNEVAANPLSQLFFAGLVLLAVAPIIVGGHSRIQKISNRVVPIFYVSVVLMTTVILLQPGVFSSSWTYLTTINVSEQVTAYTFLTALGQAFFSLCLGGTFMVLYGSYMDRKETHNIPVNAGYTVLGNSVASLISVFLILGIVSLASIEQDLSTFGPGLFFGIIPEAFQSLSVSNSLIIKGGMAIFFILFFFAAYLPMTAIIEVTTVGLVDQFGLSRRRAYAIVAVTTLVLAIPSAISPLSGGFLYNLDIFVGAIGLVVGSMIGVIAFMWYLPKKTILKEVNAGSRVKLGNKWYVWTKYVTPGAILFVVLYVLSDVLSGVVPGLNTESESDYILFDEIVDIIPVAAILLVILSLFLYVTDKRRILAPITA
jgi:NSS family neurotransmitter:Na+ symporter